jgi:antitoxin component YwqK of YwqJK toxin-antitoxin module
MLKSRLANFKTLPEYKQVCENINPVYANIIFSYLTEIKKDYYTSGELLSEVPIVNINSEEGKKHGIEIWYKKSGQFQIVKSYFNGIDHGEENWFNINGKRYRELNYFNGKEHGIEKIYCENGQIKEHLYENGKLII